MCAPMQKAEANQKKIVEAGGLSSLLMLLRSFEDETVRRVAAGAIANLAMNGNLASIFFLTFERAGALFLSLSCITIVLAFVYLDNTSFSVSSFLA
jgi:hypothetical protein